MEASQANVRRQISAMETLFLTCGYQEYFKFILNYGNRPARVDHAYSQRVLFCTRQITRTHSVEELCILILETIRFSGCVQASLGNFDRQIEVNRQIGLKCPLNPRFQGCELIVMHSSSPALVCKGCVGKAVA